MAEAGEDGKEEEQEAEAEETAEVDAADHRTKAMTGETAGDSRGTAATRRCTCQQKMEDSEKRR